MRLVDSKCAEAVLELFAQNQTKTLYASFSPQFFTHLHNTVSECVLTCYDLPQFGIQVDSAGQEHLHVSGSEDGCPGGEEDLKAADVSIDLQKRLHILSGGNVLGDSSEGKETQKEDLDGRTGDNNIKIMYTF